MIKKRYMITKRIFHIFLYLFEVIGISYLITFITNKIWPIKETIDFIERMTIFYTFYQILIYGILQQSSDIKRDEYLALLSMYKFVDIYNKNKNKNISNMIIELANIQLDRGTLNDNNIRSEYSEIKKNIVHNKSFDSDIIKTKIIYYEHCYEEKTLNWNYSIILRIFK